MTSLAEHFGLREKYAHFIDGKEVESGNGWIDVINPARVEVITRTPAATQLELDLAVAAARREFDGGAWSALDGAKRGRLLQRLADLIERDAELMANMDAVCIGRILWEPRVFDVPQGVETLRYYAGWADKIEARTIPTSGYWGRPTFSYTRREAIGVVAAIVPWNTPFMITCWKIAPALAAGCTVVIKPAEETPLTALHLAKLAKEAGFPDGVINVVTGRGADVGAALVTHPGIDKVTFTGSPEVGAEIMRTAGPLFKRVALELGGKSPQIVFADADIEAAIKGCATGIFMNQGQVCAAGSRVLVHRSVSERFTQALAEAADAVKVGDPMDQEVTMGAIAKRSQYQRVCDYIALGQREGATMLSGGNAPTERGYFVRPTVFADARNDMRIAQEEIFGPVATVISFDDDDEALWLANQTKYGLAATIWTRDISRAHQVAAGVKVGAVGINGWAPMDTRLPWGGFKTSGIGKELGYNGIEACTEEKVITVVM